MSFRNWLRNIHSEQIYEKIIFCLHIDINVNDDEHRSMRHV
jgi:hypothetical protein